MAKGGKEQVQSSWEDRKGELSQKRVVNRPWSVNVEIFSH